MNESTLGESIALGRAIKAVPKDRYTQESMREIAPKYASNPEETGAPGASEIALSEEFAAAAAGRFRWTPGLDWLANRGHYWARDEELARYTLAKDVCTSAAAGLEGKAAMRVCAASTVNAVITLARSVKGITTPLYSWDAFAEILNTPDGPYNLKTGEKEPWESARVMLFTQTTEIAPRPEPTPRWLQFLRDVFAGDEAMIEFIQRIAGYCLTGYTTEQKLFFLHGAGGNGKSVLLDTLKDIAGTYAYSLPSEALMVQKHATHPTIYAGLRGRRMAVSSEIDESAYWAESKIKELTGDEKISARFMRQDFFEFRITHKHIIAGNFKPRLKGDDYAMARRLVLIPFAQRFEGARRDGRLREKLRAEWPGILAWAIAGAVKWSRSGLAIPQSVADASSEYMRSQNDLELWIDECCQRNAQSTTTAATAYASFSRWKDASGEHAPSKKTFSQRLERMFTKRHTRTGKVFDGLYVAAGAYEDGAYDRASNGY